ncbi:MAG: sulfotransferase family 2 domain-containing protein [Planctomycetota bacterium]|jgi:hypothetical protein
MNKIIYMHMPKCAGRSIQDLLRQNTKKLNVINDSDVLEYVPIEAINQFDVIAGHLHWGVIGKPKFENHKIVTVLRDPLKRAISHYNHLMLGKTNWVSAKIMRRMKYSFMDYITTTHPDIMGLSNLYTIYLLGDTRNMKAKYMVKNAKENLKKLDFVGIYEDMAKTIKAMKERYGLKGELRRIGRTAKQHKIEISEEDKKEAVKYLYDYEIYEYAKELFYAGGEA